MHQCAEGRPAVAKDGDVWQCPRCLSWFRFGLVGGVLRWYFAVSARSRAAA